MNRTDGIGDTRPPVALTRRVTRVSWADLAKAGFELPLVSVVIFDASVARTPASRPGHAGSDDSRDGWPAGELAAAIETVARQSYPRLEAVVVDAPPAAARKRLRDLARHDGESLRVNAVHHAASDPEATWRAALAACRGELITLLTPGSSWDSGKIAADVALLLREPDVAAAACRVSGPGPSPADEPPAGLITVRRAVLEALLMDRDRGPIRAAAPAGVLAAASLLWQRLGRAHLVALVEAPLAHGEAAPPERAPAGRSERAAVLASTAS